MERAATSHRGLKAEAEGSHLPGCAHALPSAHDSTRPISTRPRRPATRRPSGKGAHAARTNTCRPGLGGGP
jgi:hypothetical protein